MTAGTKPSEALCGPISPTLAKNLTYFKPAMSEIRFGKMRFLITDRPTDFALDTFMKELQRNRVKAVVRVCEPTYPAEQLKNLGIEVLDWEFADGSAPPDEIIEKWFNLVKECFDHSATPPPPILSSTVGSDGVVVPPSADIIQPLPAIVNHHIANINNVNNDKAIAVHCVSGLGRAPLLVGIALLEAGMSWQDALFLIRTNRRGALNEKQLDFLKSYKPTGKLRKLRFAANFDAKERKSCQIM